MRNNRCLIIAVVSTLGTLAAGGARGQGRPACEPSAEVAATEALVDSGQADEGCAKVLALLERGSADPWAFRLGARCAMREKELAAAFEKALAGAARPALAAYGRGMVLSQQHRKQEAEALLKQAVQQDPQLTLAWNTLGAALKDQGQSQRALPMIETALRLCPALPLAKNNMADVQRQLGAADRLLALLEDREVIVFLLRPGQAEPRVHVLPYARDELDQDIDAFRTHLSNPLLEPGATARAHALYDRLLAPVVADLSPGPLTLIPHGPLHQLPFEALRLPAARPEDAPLLASRWTTRVAPSLSVLAHLVDQARDRPRRAPQVTALAAGAGLPVPAEVLRTLTERFPGSPQPRLRATVDDYRGAAPTARHLIISTHGEQTEGSRYQTFLDLGQRLSAADIATLPLTAELVVLLACETARANARLSDERLDLTRAFLLAGAGAVLATRWQIPAGPETYQLLLDFYEALQVDPRRDLAQALAAARRQSIARRDPAQLWAAFVLVGGAP